MGQRPLENVNNFMTGFTLHGNGTCFKEILLKSSNEVYCIELYESEWI